MIKIKIDGCVAEPGDINLPQNATLKDAIALAGGIGNNPMNPDLGYTGVVSIRRKDSSGKYYGAETFNIILEPENLGYFLNNEGFIVIQYDVENKS